MTAIILFIDTMLNCAVALFPALNLRVRKIRPRTQLLLLLTLVIADMILYPLIGFYVNLVTISSMFALIALATQGDQRAKKLNACMAIIGYMLSVLTNYLTISALATLDIDVTALAGIGVTYFVAGFFVLIYAATYLIGRALRTDTISLKIRAYVATDRGNRVITYGLLFLAAAYLVYEYRVIQYLTAGASRDIIVSNTIIMVLIYSAVIASAVKVIRSADKIYRQLRRLAAAAWRSKKELVGATDNDLADEILDKTEP